MKRGFPRPLMRVEKSKRDDNWKPRSLPIPYSSRIDNIAHWHYGRLKECTTFKKCIVCGDDVPEDIVWIYRSFSSIEPDSGPFHEGCKKQTVTLCPFIADKPARYNWSQESWAEVGPIIRGKYRKGHDESEN